MADRIPPGYYHFEDGQFVRKGDAEPMTRYHGTSAMNDWAIEEFTPYRSRDHSEIPAVYATDTENAERYAGARLPRQFTPDPGDVWEGKVYELRLTPGTVVDLGDCNDDDVIQSAVDSGADVVECPDHDNQPTTMIINPDVIEIGDVRVNRRFVYNRDRRPQEVPLDPVKAALQEYEDAKNRERTLASRRAAHQAATDAAAANRRAKGAASRRGRGDMRH